MATTWSRIEVRPLGRALGAEIRGVDLAGPIDEATMAELRAAHAEHGVVVFRDQALTPEQHLAFARAWGAIDVNRFFEAVDGHPEIAQVRKEPQDRQNIGGGWHTDHSYDAVPALGSMLLAREVPSCGGDTLFAGMCAAYEALSPGMQRLCESLTALHSAGRSFGPRSVYNEGRTSKFKLAEAAHAEVEHPVVCVHPDTGRRYLYVNPAFTMRFAEMTEAESLPLLDYLYRHQTRPEFTCRLQWSPGTLAFWDNRCTQHYALNDYHGERRLMHRITIAGTRPVPCRAAA